MPVTQTKPNTIPAASGGKVITFNAKVRTGDLPRDVGALVQAVLREAYLENTKDLLYYAKKVEHFNKLKKVLRDHLGRVRQVSTEATSYIVSQGWDADALTGEQKNDLALHLSSWVTAKWPNAGRTVPPRVSELALGDSVEAKMARVDAQMEDSFGFSLQDRNPSLYAELKTAFISGDEDKIQSAMVKFAQYLSALADNNTQGSKDGYDDVDDGGFTVGSEQWFNYYMNDPSNETARTNLAPGDVRLIEKMFNIPDGHINGSTDVHTVAKIAMDLAITPWQNEIRHGSERFKKIISGGLLTAGPQGKTASRVFGNDHAAMKEFYYGERDSILVELDISDKLPPPGVTTPSEFEDYIKNLEKDLSSIGEDAQLANVDLQNNLQKQLQTLQTMSNMSKMLHDTSMAIIRKIGA